MSPLEPLLADILASLDRRLRRFPANGRCADCGERNRLLLCRSGSQVVCYGCRQKRRGRGPSELHHIGGRPSDLVVPVPANLHRLLTVMQQLFRETLEPGSNAAVLFDLLLLRVFGPSDGREA